MPGGLEAVGAHLGLTPTDLSAETPARAIYVKVVLIAAVRKQLNFLNSTLPDGTYYLDPIG